MSRGQNRTLLCYCPNPTFLTLFCRFGSIISKCYTGTLQSCSWCAELLPTLDVAAHIYLFLAVLTELRSTQHRICSHTFTMSIFRLGNLIPVMGKLYKWYVMKPLMKCSIHLWSQKWGPIGEPANATYVISGSPEQLMCFFRKFSPITRALTLIELQ